jgi:hypothetical protein
MQDMTNPISLPSKGNCSTAKRVYKDETCLNKYGQIREKMKVEVSDLGNIYILCHVLNFHN